MSRLSREAIKEFKRIYLKNRGVELTDDEAEQLAVQLLELAAITLRNNNHSK